MELKGLFQIGRLEKAIELVKGTTIKVHTLSAMDQQKVLADVPEGLNDLARFSATQQLVLAYATESVNDTAITLDQAKELYANLQYTLLSQMFNEYTTLAEEQDKVLTELKKK